jgi:hypothetical protein
MDGTIGGASSEDIQNMSEDDFATLQNSDAIKNDKYLSTLTQDQLVDLLAQESYYDSMIDEKLGSKNDYYVRYVKDSQTGSYTPYFYNVNDVENGDYDDSSSLSNSINCYTIGSATKTREVLNQEGTVEKDSSGRYISITLINEYEVADVDDDGNQIFDDDGNPKTKTQKSTIEYSLTTNTTTDEDAYNDAMNTYNYEQYQYDQKVQEINSKIEIVQQQDKSLELELKQLDTEESAISTEIDAVKKVISKNVESSFKTFNA